MQKHLLLLFILLSFINENIAKACECAFINFTEANNYADLIFKGVVVNKKDSISIGKVFYTFKATQIWKGKTTQSITIETNFGGPACGATFTLDSEYVIYSTELSTSDVPEIHLLLNVRI